MVGCKARCVVVLPLWLGAGRVTCRSCGLLCVALLFSVAGPLVLRRKMAALVCKARASELLRPLPWVGTSAVQPLLPQSLRQRSSSYPTAAASYTVYYHAKQASYTVYYHTQYIIIHSTLSCKAGNHLRCKCRRLHCKAPRTARTILHGRRVCGAQSGATDQPRSKPGMQL